MILVKIQKISEDYKEKVQRNDFDWIFSLAKFAKKTSSVIHIQRMKNFLMWVFQKLKVNNWNINFNI